MKIVFEYLPIIFGGIRLMRQEGASPFSTIYINTILSPTQKVVTLVHELLHTTVDVIDWILERTADKLLPVNELHGLIDGKGWWNSEHHEVMSYSDDDIYIAVMKMKALNIIGERKGK